jgi:hypothetical protein
MGRPAQEHCVAPEDGLDGLERRYRAEVVGSKLPAPTEETRWPHTQQGRLRGTPRHGVEVKDKALRSRLCPVGAMPECSQRVREPLGFDPMRWVKVMSVLEHLKLKV